MTADLGLRTFEALVANDLILTDAGTPALLFSAVDRIDAAVREAYEAGLRDGSQ